MDLTDESWPTVTRVDTVTGVDAVTRVTTVTRTVRIVAMRISRKGKGQDARQGHENAVFRCKYSRKGKRDEE